MTLVEEFFFLNWFVSEESLASNLHPLSLLYAGHPEIEQLSRNINDAFELAKSVNNLLKQLCESFVLGVVSK